MPDDRMIAFTLPARHARGRVVRLDRTLSQILSAHAYPEPIARLLAETLALTALIGSMLRPDQGQVTLQARGEGGPVRLLVADYRDGELRGYAAQDLDRRFPAPDGDEAALAYLMGEGRLVITLDQTAAAERYQGIVALEAGRLEAAAQAYFIQSEQLPTRIRLAARPDEAGGWTAGGLLIQHLARAEAGGERLDPDRAHPDWEHVDVLAASLRDSELTDPALDLETLVWRLFHGDAPGVTAEQRLTRGCRCSPDRIVRVLEQFTEEDRAEMRNPEGLIAVDCEFCARQFLLEA
jgi:molecular chaperone Hsp33